MGEPGASGGRAFVVFGTGTGVNGYWKGGYDGRGYVPAN